MSECSCFDWSSFTNIRCWQGAELCCGPQHAIRVLSPVSPSCFLVCTKHAAQLDALTVTCTAFSFWVLPTLCSPECCHLRPGLPSGGTSGGASCSASFAGSPFSSGRADLLAGSPPACNCWVHRVRLVRPCVHRCWQTLWAGAGADSWPALKDAGSWGGSAYA